ncbi:MAG: type I 3-dehydroquinate dehydratase [Candidatus Omnitrophica bacterium]|nr:type I 3-dehydroquinate dehydratase [Candidatus Omnitrophota bacterium]
MNRTLLCVPLAVSTTEEAVAILQSPDRPFDIAEVRLDYLSDPNPEQILGAKPCPLIFTHRAARDGGNWSGGEDERLDLLRKAELAGADFIDIEADAVSRHHWHGRARRIVSYHNFSETPANLPEMVRQMEEGPCEIVKVATLARSHADVLAVLGLLKAANKPTIALAMGPLGGITRILGPKFGAFLVFASLATGQESAPGQIPAKDMVQHYRFGSISPETRVYFWVDAFGHGRRVAAALNSAMKRANHYGVVVDLPEGDPSELARVYTDLPLAGVASALNADPAACYTSWTGSKPDPLLLDFCSSLGKR